MKNNFLGGAFFSVALNLLVKTIWILGIEIAVQRTFGTEEYGSFFSLFNFTLLFLIFLDLGVTNFNTRNIARNQHLFDKNFSKLFSIKLILGILYLFIVVVAGIIMDLSTERMKLLLYLSLFQIFASVTLFLRSNLAAFQKFKMDAFIAVSDRLILIIVCSVLIFTSLIPLKFTIVLFSQLLFLSAFLTSIIAFITNLSLGNFIYPKLTFRLFRKIIHQSFPFAILFLLMSIYTRADGFLIDQLHPNGKTESGIYAAGFRLFDAYSQIIIIFSGILLPVFARQLKNNERTEPSLITVLNLLIFISGIITILCIYFSLQIAEILYSQKIAETARILKILMAAIIPFLISLIMGSLLTANGNLKALNWVALISVIINLTLNFILIPMHGSFGASISMIATHSFSAICLSILAYSRIKIKVNSMFWFKLLIYLFTGLIGSYFIKELLDFSFALPLIIIVMLIMGWILKIIPINDLKLVILAKIKSGEK